MSGARRKEIYSSDSTYIEGSMNEGGEVDELARHTMPGSWEVYGVVVEADK